MPGDHIPERARRPGHPSERAPRVPHSSPADPSLWPSFLSVSRLCLSVFCPLPQVCFLPSLSSPLIPSQTPSFSTYSPGFCLCPRFSRSVRPLLCRSALSYVPPVSLLCLVCLSSGPGGPAFSVFGTRSRSRNPPLCPSLIPGAGAGLGGGRLVGRVPCVLWGFTRWPSSLCSTQDSQTCVCMWAHMCLCVCTHGRGCVCVHVWMCGCGSGVHACEPQGEALGPFWGECWLVGNQGRALTLIPPELTSLWVAIQGACYFLLLCCFN